MQGIAIEPCSFAPDAHEPLCLCVQPCELHPELVVEEEVAIEPEVEAGEAGSGSGVITDLQKSSATEEERRRLFEEAVGKRFYCASCGAVFDPQNDGGALSESLPYAALCCLSLE